MDTDDPRTTGAHLRRLASTDSAGEVTLVGAVHDHPASTYRVVTTVGAVDPDVLALELPPLSVPLYEQYADGERTPPAFGGEMSAAVQAAATDRVVGIDGPSVGFVVHLLRTLAADGAPASAVRSTLRSLRSVTKRAVVCRVAAALAALTGVRLAVGEPTAHDCEPDDDPATQAEDERSRVRRARSVAETFGRSDGARVRTTARDDRMADRLSSLRREGSVVAVVGIDHLDPLAERLVGDTDR